MKKRVSVINKKKLSKKLLSNDSIQLKKSLKMHLRIFGIMERGKKRGLDFIDFVLELVVNFVLHQWIINKKQNKFIVYGECVYMYECLRLYYNLKNIKVEWWLSITNWILSETNKRSKCFCPCNEPKCHNFLIRSLVDIVNPTSTNSQLVTCSCPGCVENMVLLLHISYLLTCKAKVTFVFINKNYVLTRYRYYLVYRVINSLFIDQEDQE